MPTSGEHHPGSGTRLRRLRARPSVSAQRLVELIRRRCSCPVAATLTVAALSLAACGTGTGPDSTATTTAATTTTAPPSTSQPVGTTPSTATGPSVLSSITAAVVAFEGRRGVPPGHYVIEGVALSTTDPSWAKFEVVAAARYRGTFPSGYGIAHDAGGWTITGIGATAVGCRGHDAVPVAVRSDLGLICQ